MPVAPFAAVVTPITLGTPRTGTLAANDVVFFQIKPNTDGRLVAQLHAPGGTTRLTLLDDQGNTLLTSDGQSPTNPDDLIDIHVQAGTDYLAFENLGGVVTYTLTTNLTPATPPFQTLPTGSFPTSIVSGDFNGDGRADLAAANSDETDSSGNPIPGADVSVLLGRRRHLPAPVRYAAGTSPVSLVAVTSTGTAGPTWPPRTRAPATCRCCWARRRHLPAPGHVPGGGQPGTLVSGDFNGDGRTDLAAANSASNDVSVLLGNGDGTFQPQVRYAAGTSPVSLVAGDFNGDGRPTWPPPTLFRRRVGAAGQRRRHLPAPGHVPGGGCPRRLAAGDFNGDGRTDLAVANADSTRVGAAGRRRRHLPAPGDRTRRDTAAPRGGGRLQRRRPADLATANELLDDVSVLLGNGDGTFQPRCGTRRGPASLARGGRLQRRRPPRPGRRRTDATTCRCCWATATAPSRTR